MERLTTIPDLRRAVAAARRGGARIGLVPTMGALHEGHLEHVRRVREQVEVVVVSIFVNPTQFGPGEDFDRYPRDLDRDEAQLAGLADLVWAPGTEVVYPAGPPATTVSVAGLGEALEGESRPGHFDGVCTVVTKLLNQVQPDVVTFGRKDFQQLVVVRRMLADLDLPVSILEIPTAREPDGLARSSRNQALEPADRRAARALPLALRGAVETARAARREGGRAPAGMLREVARATLEAQPRVRTDYVDVVDPDTLRAPRPPRTQPPHDGANRRLLVAVAAHVGPVRLIDNVVVGDEEDEDRILRATGA